MHKLSFACAVLGSTFAAMAQCAGGPGPRTILTQDPFGAQFYVGSPATPSAGFSGFTLLLDVHVDAQVTVTAMETWLYDQGAGNPVNPNQVGNSGTVNIYVCPTLYRGSETLRPGTAGSPWTRVVDAGNNPVTGTVVVQAFPTNSVITLSNPAGFVLPAGDYGFALEFNPPTAGTNPGPLHPLITAPGVVVPPVSDQFLTLSNQSFQSDAFVSAAPTTDGIDLQMTYTPAANAAYWTAFGTGCYFNPEAFYEEFNTAGSFDLANTSMTGFAQTNSWLMVNSGTTGFVAPTTASITINPPAVTTTASWDDALAAPTTLPFTFNAPGGVSTNVITVGSNGMVMLEAATTTADCFGYYNALNDFRDRGPRLSPFWGDLDPSVSGGIFIESFGTTPNQFTCVTWQGVEEWNVLGPTNTFQLQLHENGNIELYYQGMSLSAAPAITGYTQGGGNQLQTFDISARIAGGSFETGDGNVPPILTMTRRPKINSVGANAPNFLVSNIDNTTTSFCIIALSLVGNQAGIPLAGFGMPGCQLYLGLVPGPILNFAGVTPSGTAQIPFPIANNNNFLGAVVYAQGAPLTPALNTAGIITSNGLCMRIGL